LEIKERFCPVCQNKIDRNALVCRYCGASLEQYLVETGATTRNVDEVSKDSEKTSEILIDDALIPENGIVIYTGGASEPIYLRLDHELVLGRKVGETSESLFDLSGLGGYQMGISRRHAMIRQTKTGYEIIDLSSTNGTWLNNERIVPNKPYPLASGSQLRLGRMKLLVLYHSVSKK